MIVWTRVVIDMETGQILGRDGVSYDGDVALCDRSLGNQAQTAANNAAGTASTLGSQAQGINSQIMPFLTGELEHPQGYSQGDLTQMLNANAAGAGGATSGLTGEAMAEAARTGNTAGFSGALDAAARTQQQAESKGSEGIAASNAGLKQQQQQSAASSLQNLEGTDMGDMLKSMGLQNDDLNTQLTAGRQGWFQNLNTIVQMIEGGGQSAGSILKGLQ